MCGRYAFFSPHEAVKRVFGVGLPADLPPRYNVAPTQPVPAIRESADGRRELVMLRWGLIPGWAKDPSIGNRMINARAETLGERPAYRRAFRDRRCLVLADGWYEWQATPSGKQPWFIRRREGEPIAFAGLWESWRDPADGTRTESCAIVTRDAPGELARIHGRVPAVIDPAAAQRWLDPGQRDGAAVSDLLTQADAADFEAWPVSRRVNDPHNDGPELVRPAKDG